MKNKPWKKWKTRKATLIFSIFCVCLYTIVGIIMGFCDKSIDGTLTEQVFSFFKWLTITGCAITITGAIKKHNDENSEE